MAKVIGNLKVLIGEAAKNYISLNSGDFKSEVPGPQGIEGPEGPQGVGVHHMKGTSTTDSEGDFSTAGETDTYTFYADANEERPLAWFSVKNGEDPYRKALDKGYVGSEVEFYNTLANITEYADISQAAVIITTANRDAVAADKIVVANDKALAQVASAEAIGYKDQAQASAEVVQTIFLGAKATDPTVDNQGNPLVVGVMYYNTTQGMLKIWTGTVWATGAFAASGAVISFNGRDGAVTLNGQDLITVLGKDVSDAIKYSETEKVISSVNVLGLNTAVNLNANIGEFTWNQDENTANLGLNGAMLQIGQEQLIRVRNTTGSTIVNGSVVMATGTIGNSGRITVAPANLTNANAKMVLGVVTESISAGADGFVTTFGKVRQIQTNGGQYGEAWVDGDVIYVKDSGNGALTKVVPSDTQVKLPIAIVVNAHASNGTLFIRVNSIDENHAKAELALKANAANAVLTGVPTAPTASVGTSTTQLATTAYVMNEINKVEEW